MLAFNRMGIDYMRHKGQQNSRRAQNLKDERNIQEKIIIVTGSNCGIGKETALQLAKRGAIVILACRDLAKGEEAKADILEKIADAKLDLLQLDLGELASVRKFVENFKSKYSRLDILINNAGLGLQKLTKTKDDFETNMGVNHLGHFLLTLLLLDHLKKGAPSRIVCVSSMMSQLAHLNVNDLLMEKDKSLGFLNYRPYSNSKLANALFVKELARKLKTQGQKINCYALCPGMVKTNVTRYNPWHTKLSAKALLPLIGFDAAQGCETTLYCALSTQLENETGQFYRFAGPWREMAQKLDDKQARELWVQSEKLVGLEDFSVNYFGREKLMEQMEME